MVRGVFKSHFILDRFLYQGAVKIEDLQLVAEVEAMSIEEAFEVCQNMSGS